MPTTDDRNKWEENERRRNTIFKVVEPIVWTIVIIIVIAVCLGAIWAMGCFSVSFPVDARPSFIQ